MSNDQTTASPLPSQSPQDLTPIISCPPGNILIEVITQPAMDGGIEKLDTDLKRSQEGRVLVVGDLPMDRLKLLIELRRDLEKAGTDVVVQKETLGNLLSACNEGDIVIFRQWTGTEYKVGSKQYLFLTYDDIKGVKNA